MSFGALLALRSDTAEMFNEHGLFGHAEAAPAAHSPAGAPGRQPAAAAALQQGPDVTDPPSAQAPEGAGLQPAPAASSGEAASDGGPAAAPMPQAQGGRRAFVQGPALASPPAAAARGAEKARLPAPAGAMSAARSRPATRGEAGAATASGAAAAQVTLGAGAGAGLSLVARAQSLTAGERTRLRSAIEALLARSGLAARAIVINGESEPPRGSGGD
jgi:hypothetical protein